MKNLDSKPGDVWDDKKGWTSPFSPIEKRLPWTTDKSINDPWQDFDLFQKWLSKKTIENYDVSQCAEIYSLFCDVFCEVKT